MTRKKKRSPHRDRPTAPTPRPATPPDKVMLALAVLGLLITGFAFLGVNMFLSGLHSYGEL